MKHWIYKYLNKPWTDTYDCFAHFVEVQSNEFGIEGIMSLDDLPAVLDYGAALAFAKNNPQITDKWEHVEKLQEGDAVIFGIGPVKFHIGTYLEIDGGGVLHCGLNGVVFHSMEKMKRRGTVIAMQLRYKHDG